MTPLWPGVCAAAVTAFSVGGVTVFMRFIAPGLPAWVLLGLQATAGLITSCAFTLLVRFPAVQDVVDEVIEDLVPAVARPYVDRIRRRPHGGTRS
jgi:hypothetical protein